MKSPTFGLGLRLATTVHWQHVFLYTSLPLLHDRYVKLPYFTFYEGREHEKPISFFFFFFFYLRYSLFEFNSRKIRQHLTIERGGIRRKEFETGRINFSCDVFTAVPVVDA